MSRRGAQFLDIGLHRMLGLSVTQPLPDLVARLNDFQPNHLNGYPSVIGLLAEQLADGSAFSSTRSSPAASRSPHAASLPEQDGVRPFNFYATTEGLYGHDCPSARCTCSTTCASSRTSTRTTGPCLRARRARLLVTNLFNRAQPLIRFEVSDLVALEPEPCPCGRT